VQQPAATVRVKRGTAQQHLLDSAQRLFAERGYRGTTTKGHRPERRRLRELDLSLLRVEIGIDARLGGHPAVRDTQHFSDDWERNDAFRAQPHQDIVHSFVGEVVDLIDSHHGLARAILNVLVERPPDFDTAAIGAQFAGILKDMGPAMAEFLNRRELTSSNRGLVLRMGIIAAITNVVLLPESYGEDEQPPTKAVIIDELTNFIVYGLQPAPPKPVT
jgi:hypothetical protein